MEAHLFDLSELAHDLVVQTELPGHDLPEDDGFVSLDVVKVWVELQAEHRFGGHQLRLSGLVERDRGHLRDVRTALIAAARNSRA